MKASEFPFEHAEPATSRAPRGKKSSRWSASALADQENRSVEGDQSLMGIQDHLQGTGRLKRGPRPRKMTG